MCCVKSHHASRQGEEFGELLLRAHLLEDGCGAVKGIFRQLELKLKRPSLHWQVR